MPHAEPKVTIDLKEYNELIKIKEEAANVSLPYKKAISAIMTEVTQGYSPMNNGPANTFALAVRVAGVKMTVAGESHSGNLNIICEMLPEGEIPKLK